MISYNLKKKIGSSQYFGEKEVKKKKSETEGVGRIHILTTELITGSENRTRVKLLLFEYTPILKEIDHPRVVLKITLFGSIDWK